MKKADSILILITFIIESFLIIPLLWTIPGFILYGKVSKNKATEGQKIALSVLGIIFGVLLGIIDGVLIIVDLNNTENKIVEQLP